MGRRMRLRRPSTELDEAGGGKRSQSSLGSMEAKGGWLMQGSWMKGPNASLCGLFANWPLRKLPDAVPRRVSSSRSAVTTTLRKRETSIATPCAAISSKESEVSQLLGASSAISQKNRQAIPVNRAQAHERISLRPLSPSCGAALCPNGISHRLRDEKSLVCCQDLLPLLCRGKVLSVDPINRLGRFHVGHRSYTADLDGRSLLDRGLRRLGTFVSSFRAGSG